MTSSHPSSIKRGSLRLARLASARDLRGPPGRALRVTPSRPGTGRDEGNTTVRVARARHRALGVLAVSPSDGRKTCVNSDVQHTYLSSSNVPSSNLSSGTIFPFRCQLIPTGMSSGQSQSIGSVSLRGVHTGFVIRIVCAFAHAAKVPSKAQADACLDARRQSRRPRSAPHDRSSGSTKPESQSAYPLPSSPVPSSTRSYDLRARTLWEMRKHARDLRARFRNTFAKNNDHRSKAWAVFGVRIARCVRWSNVFHAPLQKDQLVGNLEALMKEPRFGARGKQCDDPIGRGAMRDRMLDPSLALAIGWLQKTVPNHGKLKPSCSRS